MITPRHLPVPRRRGRPLILALVGVAWISAVAGSAGASAYVASDLFTIAAPGPAPVWPSSGPQAAAGRQVVGLARYGVGDGPTNALLWDRTGAPINLHPAGYYGSSARATDGARQAGEVVSLRDGDPEGGTITHAAMWNGTPAFLDLHPANLPGVAESGAYGTRGNQQVGYATVFSPGPVRRPRHAVLWNGTPVGVDLHPTNLPGFASSLAYGTDGASQVGYARGADSRDHALLWRGTPEAVDLHPAGLPRITDSVAHAVSGAQQVGYGLGPDPAGGTSLHALVWEGSAATAVDLHPTGLAGFTDSAARGTDGTRQVGYGRTGGAEGTNHALLWEGTAATAVDLHLSLPAGFVSSEASTIDGAGRVFGTAVDAAGRTHAIEWALPEPSAMGVLGVATLGLLRRRRQSLAVHA